MCVLCMYECMCACMCICTCVSIYVCVHVWGVRLNGDGVLMSRLQREYTIRLLVIVRLFFFLLENGVDPIFASASTPFLHVA